MSELKEHPLEICCQQVLLPDASIYSVQWIDMAAAVAHGLTADFLLQHYFRVVRDATLGLIRPIRSVHGVEFRIAGTRFALLAFEPARFEADQAGESVHLCISGGLLVQAGECDRGMFSLQKSSRGAVARITVQLSDYCPLLLGSRNPSRVRTLFYGLTQSYFHKVVTFRYLSSLYRVVTGAKPRAGVKKVQVRQGVDI